VRVERSGFAVRNGLPIVDIDVQPGVAALRCGIAVVSREERPIAEVLKAVLRT
jgi:hypothetical protein